jgi:hypothetical protein
MPVDPVTGALIPFTRDEISAMSIKTFGIRDRSHPTESRRIDENVMTRKFSVLFDSRYDFCELVLGDSKTFTDGVGVTQLSRLMPDPNFGRHPESTQIVATRIDEITPHDIGIDNANQWVESDRSEITVFYEQVPFTLSSDAGTTTERARFTSRSPTSQVEVEAFTLPGAAFKYTRAGGGAPHGVPVPFNVSYTRPVQRFTLTWHYLPNDLYTTNGALFQRLFVGTGDGIPFLGTVNKSDLVIPSLGTYPAGTLLLEGLEDRRMMSPLTSVGLASLKWDVGLRMCYTPRGWLNLFYFNPAAPATSGYYPVSVDGVLYTPATLPDKFGLYNCREFADIWLPHIP